MPLDPSIFQRGAQQRAQGNQNLLNTFQTLAGQYMKNEQLKGVRLDKQRADAQKLQAGQDKLMANRDYAERAILTKVNQGIPLTPEDEATLKAIQAQKATEMTSNALGYQVSKYKPLGSSTFDMLQPPVQETGQQPVVPTQAEVAPTSPSSQVQPAYPTFQEATKDIGSGVKGSPAFELDKAKQGLKFESDRLMQDIKDGKATALKEGSRESLQELVDRMRAINKELKTSGEIRGEGQDLTANISSAVAGTSVGQAVEGITDPKSQALRKEYEGLRSMMLPFFASASGLSAKSIDSEGERKAILDSFGDPAGLYESNEKLLDALASKVGTGVADPRIKQALDAGWTMKEINEFIGK